MRYRRQLRLYEEILMIEIWLDLSFMEDQIYFIKKKVRSVSQKMNGVLMLDN